MPRCRDYRRKFGITLEEYDAQFARQGGLCAICGEPESVVDRRTGEVRRLAVDHGHDDGRLRGLLCHHCNTGLGNFKDNPWLLVKAVGYLAVAYKPSGP